MLIAVCVFSNTSPSVSGFNPSYITLVTALARTWPKRSGTRASASVYLSLTSYLLSLNISVSVIFRSTRKGKNMSYEVDCIFSLNYLLSFSVRRWLESGLTSHTVTIVSTESHLRIRVDGILSQERMNSRKLSTLMP